MKLTTWLLFLSFFILINCGGGGGASTVGEETTSDNYSISATFTRVQSGTLNPFLVTATILNNGIPVKGLAETVNIILGRGTRSSITEVADGQYQFTVTPTQTGEHLVTVSYQSVSLSQTALVFSGVHSDWEQPMAVSGLVNTEGYEDGITISPDGEYLFVHYGPIYFGGLFLFQEARTNGGCGGDRLLPTRCTHDWIDNVKGPITAPERPGFFDGRMANGKFLHNANSWNVGIEQSPIFAPSTMFYGFKRQSDGSYKEPFYLAFEDSNDALINPFGLSFINNANGTTTVAFAMDDPSDSETIDFDGNGTLDAQSLADVYTLDIALGSNTNLGTFVPTGVAGEPPVRDTFFPSQKINFGSIGIEGNAGTQGNPHLFSESGTIKSIWVDDERDTGGDRGDLSVHVLTSGTYLNGTWTKVTLPSVINEVDPSNEIQPFFTGQGLYYTHINDNGDLPEIYYNAYNGDNNVAGYQNASNWGATTKILEVGTADSIGKITAIGEPTIANINGIEYLYFVYGYIRGYDATSGLADINLQAGYIKKK